MPSVAKRASVAMCRSMLLLAAVTNAIQEDPSNSPAFRCQSEAQCERLQAVKHPASNRRQILAALRKNGFVVVRGDDSSGFFGSVATLDAAQAAAESALDELREEYDAQLFTQARFPRAFPKKLPAAPWLYGPLDGGRVPPGARETVGFQYREGYSCAALERASKHAPARQSRALHGPTISHKPHGKNKHLTWLCNEYFGASSCAQTSQGCLWLFPGASITRWHRDFDEDWQLLTVVTAATDYPQDVGWTLMQRGTQFEGLWENVSSNYRPNPSRGEPPTYRAVLSKGDTLIFTATTKHAVAPNPTNVARRMVNKSRGLLFSLYAVDGREDNLYQPQTAKSLLKPETDTRPTRKCVCKTSWRSSFCKPAVQYGCQSSGQCDESNFCMPEDHFCMGRDGELPDDWGVHCDESNIKNVSRRPFLRRSRI